MAAPNTPALVTWLKSFQYPGHFPALDEVPGPVVAHVRGAPGPADGVTANADADRTGQRYREIVRLRLECEAGQGGVA